MGLCPCLYQLELGRGHAVIWAWARAAIRMRSIKRQQTSAIEQSILNPSALTPEQVHDASGYRH